MKKLYLLLLPLCFSAITLAKTSASPLVISDTDADADGRLLTNANTGLNLDFIRGENQVRSSLLSRLNGDYLPRNAEYLKIYINNTSIHDGVVKLNIVNDQICISNDWLNRADIDYTLMSDFYNPAHNCYVIEQIEYVDVVYKPNSNLITVKIPQLYAKQDDNIDSNHDVGDTALKLDYRLNLYKNQGSDAVAYAAGTTQLNLGSWVLMNDWYAQSDKNLENTSTRLYKSLYDIGSEVYIGNLWAQPSNSQSFEFDGLTLQTDSSLRAWQRNIYAPILKGIAQTTARVSVFQGELLLTEVTVSPGPFELADYTPVGNGNIRMVVTESTGEQQVKTYPITTLPNMIRSGISNYAFSIGSKKSTDDDDSLFLNMNYDAGFDYFGVTSGMILNKDYHSVGLGITTSLADYGSLSFANNISYAFSNETEQWIDGLSLELKYAKKVGDFTDFRVIGYHYNNKNYVNFANYNKNYTFTEKRSKNRYELIINHDFDHFSIDASGWSQNYWNDDSTDIGYDITLGSSYNDISYSFSVGRQENYYNNETSFSFNTSIPLNRLSFLSNSFYYETNSGAYSNALNYNQTLNNEWNYGLSVISNKEDPLYTTARTNFKADHFSLSGLVAKGEDRYTVSGNVSGSIIGLWEDKSLNFSNNQGSTIALGDIQDIQNAKINARTTNTQGHALISLSANRVNTIKADTRNIDEVIELDSNAIKVTPTKYSIHHLNFDYNEVNRYIFKLVDQDGNSLPFGAEIFSENNSFISFVSTNGIVQFSLVTEESEQIETMKINTDNIQCQFNINNIPSYQYGEEIENVYCM